jgi:hypothetical protein
MMSAVEGVNATGRHEHEQDARALWLTNLNRRALCSYSTSNPNQARDSEQTELLELNEHAVAGDV